MASEKKTTQDTCDEEQKAQKTQLMKPPPGRSNRIERVLHRRMEQKHSQMSRTVGNASFEFFCGTFDDLGKENEEHQHKKSEKNTVIIIGENDEDSDPLIPGEIVQSRLKQTHVFVPRLSAVPQERLAQANLKLRCLEDEGLYVQDRPTVPWWINNKMSNRLIEQDKGERWFDPSGCLNSLPDPVQRGCCFQADPPAAGPSPGLSTGYIEPSTIASNTSSKCDAAMWQLDLSLAGLIFTHHPLFSREHVLAQNLLELHELYHKKRQMPDATTALQGKLKGLEKLESGERDWFLAGNQLGTKQEIRRDTERQHREIETDYLLKNICNRWTTIKKHRAENAFTSTTVRLQLHRLKDMGGNQSATRSGKPEEIFVTADDGVFKRRFSDHLDQKEEDTTGPGERLKNQAHQANPAISRSDLIPVLSRSRSITPSLSCPLGERIRRYELLRRKITVKIFYNEKLVSFSDPASLDGDFRVNIQQIFHVRIMHHSENIMLQICETSGQKSTEVAKVYLPIPDRNVLSNCTSLLETIEFSNKPVVQPHYDGVGSKESLFSMAPKATKTNFTNSQTCQVLKSHTHEEFLGRLRDVKYDPNHPSNTAIQGLLREACERRDGAKGCFHMYACEEEFDFTTEEDFDKSRRFELLRARNCRRAPPEAIPLHDSQIKDSMFALTTHFKKEYSAVPRYSLVEEEEDPITSHILHNIQQTQRMLDSAKRRIDDIRKKYKLSDIVNEHHGADTPKKSSWDIFRGLRPLNPRRTTMRKLVPSSLLADTHLKVRVTVNSAMGPPVRQKDPLKRIRTRNVFWCGLPASSNRATFSEEEVIPEVDVQPFFEVRFQGITCRSCVKQGPNPHWKEDFTFDFRAKGGDYSLEGLSSAENDIVINMFDNISFQRAETSVLMGCGAQVFSGRQWLGSVTIPFTTLLQRSTVCESLPIGQSPLLLGYTWPEEDSFNDQAVRTEESSLEVFINLDPPVSIATELSARDEDQISQWLFPSDEDEGLLRQAFEFERQCRATSEEKLWVSTTVFNSDARLVLATRFFGPLAPPKEILQDTSLNSMTALDILAMFVSVIPTVPCLSGVGNSRAIWLSSEQCLELAVGNHMSLAVLLCNLFHYQQVEVWLLLGESVLEKETSYILTKNNHTYLVWNPRDGKHYDKCDTRCPLQTVKGLVNGHNVWFNVQRTKRTSVINFDLSDPGSWKALFLNGSQAATSGLPIQVKYRPVEMELVYALRRRVEVKLRNSIMEWRLPHITRWNTKCSEMLREALELLEKARSSDSTLTETVQVLETMTDYKVTGFPLHLPYRDMNSLVDTVYNTGIHSTEIPDTSFALAVYIRPYPNLILSTWVFLARLAKRQ
ncbi:unnamed protein product [Gadus morhua 'NCC']